MKRRTEKQIAAEFKYGNQAARRKGPPPEVQAKLQQYSAEAIDIVYKIASKSKSDKARLQACQMLIDRSWGRVPQALKVSQHDAPDPTKLAKLLLSQARDGVVELANEIGVARVTINPQAINVDNAATEDEDEEFLDDF